MAELSSGNRNHMGYKTSLQKKHTTSCSRDFEQEGKELNFSPLIQRIVSCLLLYFGGHS